MKQKTFNIKVNPGKDGKLTEMILEGELSIKNAPAIYNALLSSGIKSEKLIVKLKNVEKLDITILQLMISFEKFLKEKRVQADIHSDLPDDIVSLLRNSGFNSFTNS